MARFWLALPVRHADRDIGTSAPPDASKPPIPAALTTPASPPRGCILIVCSCANADERVCPSVCQAEESIQTDFIGFREALPGAPFSIDVTYGEVAPGADRVSISTAGTHTDGQTEAGNLTSTQTDTDAGLMRLDLAFTPPEQFRGPRLSLLPEMFRPADISRYERWERTNFRLNANHDLEVISTSAVAQLIRLALRPYDGVHRYAVNLPGHKESKGGGFPVKDGAKESNSAGSDVPDVHQWPHGSHWNIVLTSTLGAPALAFPLFTSGVNRPSADWLAELSSLTA